MASFTQVGGRDAGDIKIYALSTCGWCKKTKALLSRNNVGYAYIDVDLLPAAELEPVRREQMRWNPSGSFPTILVDGKRCIVGYDEPRLMELIGGGHG